ncbi:hypothetical protein [Mangrovitalea sediminis]|uniref:hypothetical protein n=1 Tax=Mangrovitalea sediminis TaxID=1982043 RepID=UPI000BE4D31B|nr:hypothetical protein [Mangrovitalea sediminis]
MSSIPPEFSNIKIGRRNGYEEIVMPSGNGGFMRFVIGIFIICWLGGWVVGFHHAVAQLLSGKGGAFLIFWLGGWTVGGAFAVAIVVRIFRKPVPERLLLNKPNLAFDSGVPPFKLKTGSNSPKDQWQALFPKRKKLQFTPDQINTLSLRETYSGNRLTVDVGNMRIDLAGAVTEVEREWLYQYLKSNYS